MIGRRQQQQPVSTGLCIAQGAHIFGVLCPWTRHFGWVSDHKGALVPETTLPGSAGDHSHPGNAEDHLVVCSFISLHRPRNLTQSRRTGFQDPVHDPGGFLGTGPIIKKILYKWQKLGTLVHGNLLVTGSRLIGLIQYRRFPLFSQSLSELVSEYQAAALDKTENMFYVCLIPLPLCLPPPCQKHAMFHLTPYIVPVYPPPHGPLSAACHPPSSSPFPLCPVCICSSKTNTLFFPQIYLSSVKTTLESPHMGAKIFVPPSFRGTTTSFSNPE